MKHPVLFVHYDGTTRKTTANRSAINTHSNRVYHALKREKEVKKHTQSTSNKSRHSPSPMDLIGKGNSDPFNSFAVVIDPVVNRIMNFHLHVTLPKRFSVQVETQTRSLNARREWNEAVTALHDTCAGYAILALFGTRLADIAHDASLSRSALVYKNKSLVLLRNRLATHDYKNPDELYQSILLLLMADFGARRIEDAAMHAKVLMHLIQASGGLSNCDPKTRRLLLSIDGHQSATSLTRPWLYLGGWSLGSYPEMTDLEAKMAWLALKTPLDETIDDIWLRSIFNQLREAIEVFDWATSNRSDNSSDALLWAMTQGSIFVNRLVNKYVDITEANSYNQLHAPPITMQDINIQASTCLATICWTRRIFGVEAWKVGSVVQDSSPTILPRLRDLLMSSEVCTSRYYRHGGKYSKLRLWALYIGASVEQDHVGHFNFPGSGDNWFTTSLMEQAEYLGLNSWQGMREALQGFLYSDRVIPHGSVWFPKVIAGAQVL